MEIIEGLNRALELERQAQIQYEQHAATLTGPYFAFAADLLKHAEEERGHAVALNDLIAYFGGTPSAGMEPAKTADSNEEMIRQDVAGEAVAIRQYKELLSYCMGDFEACGEAIPVLQDILGDEVHHATDLQSILGKGGAVMSRGFESEAEAAPDSKEQEEQQERPAGSPRESALARTLAGMSGKKEKK